MSPAAITTRLPAARNWLASLPIVVVLPEPLTPTTSTTCGRFRVSGIGRATGSRIAAISPASASRISRAPTRRPNRPSAMFALTFSAVSTPMSAWISSSSRPSSMSSSRTRPFSCPSSRPTSPARSGSAASGAGASSMIASSPSSIFDDDLNSRSFSFWKNAMEPSARLPSRWRAGMQTGAPTASAFLLPQIRPPEAPARHAPVSPPQPASRTP